MKTLLILLPYWANTQPYPGLWFVNQSLLDNGFESKVIDYNYLISKKVDYSTIMFETWTSNKILEHPEIAYELDNVINDILSQNPDAVGFAVFHVTNITVRYVIRELRRAKPEIKIFVGGACFYEKHYFSEFLKTGEIDAILLGEAEISAPLLIKCWTDNISIKEMNIQGIETKDYFSPKKLSTDLSHLPIIKYSNDIPPYGEIAIQTSRGCYASCSFCREGEYSGKYRYRSGEDIFKEMTLNSNIGTHRRFSIVDSTIQPLHPEFQKLIALLEKHHFKFSFGGNLRNSSGLTLDRLLKLKSAGFDWATFGIESGSDTVLKLMNKKITMKVVCQNLLDCKTAGIRVFINLLIGFPGETEIELQETMDFLTNYVDCIEVVNVGYGMAIGSDTDVWRNPLKYNVKVDKFGKADYSSGDWETIDGQNTAEIRKDRIMRIRNHCKKLGLMYTGRI